MKTLDDKITSLEKQLAIPVDEYEAFKIYNQNAINADMLFNECVCQIQKHRENLALEILRLKEEKANEQA